MIINCTTFDLMAYAQLGSRVPKWMMMMNDDDNDGDYDDDDDDCDEDSKDF